MSTENFKLKSILTITLTMILNMQLFKMFIYMCINIYIYIKINVYTHIYKYTQVCFSLNIIGHILAVVLHNPQHYLIPFAYLHINIYF